MKATTQLYVVILLMSMSVVSSYAEGIGDPIMMFGMTAANSLDFSPDGSRVLVGHSCAMVLGNDDSQVIHCLFGHDWKVSSAKYSLDGTRIVTGGAGGTARLWNANTGSAIRDFVGHSDEVTAVDFSPDGSRVLTGSKDGTAILWNIFAGAAMRTFSGHSGQVTSVDFSSDGTMILTGSTDQTARVWDASTGEIAISFSGHSSAITSVAFSPDGNSAISGDSTSAIIWDIATGIVLQTVTPSEPVTCVAYSPDGSLVLTADETGDAILWNPVTGEQETVFFDPDSTLQPVRTVAAFSPDGSQVIVGGENLRSGVRLHNVSTGEFLREIGTTVTVKKGFFSPDGRYILTNADDGLVAHLWDVEKGTLVQTFQGHSGELGAMGFSPQGDKIVTGSADRTVKVWRVSDGEVLMSLDAHSERCSARFSPDGTRIASWSYDDTCKLWDAETGDLIRTFTGHTSNIFGLRFSPDGQYFATGSPDKTARVWDLSTGESITVYTEHTDTVYGAFYSPDGTKVITPSRDQTCKIWDPFTGETSLTFEEHSAAVLLAMFSPNGDYVLSGSIDGKAYIWDAETGEVLKEFDSDIERFPLDQSIFSPDGMKVLRWNKSVADDFELPAVLWDLGFSSTRVFVLDGFGTVYQLR